MGGLTYHLRVKALKSTVALPAVFLAPCPVEVSADTVSVSGDPFSDPSATATAGPNSDFGNSASAYGVQPFPSVNMNNGGAATASATTEQDFSLPVAAYATAQGGDSAENTSGGGGYATADERGGFVGKPGDKPGDRDRRICQPNLWNRGRRRRREMRRPQRRLAAPGGGRRSR